jgi:thioredoxin-dependent peroxiredoxin
VSNAEKLLASGEAAPEFRLPDATGRLIGLSDFIGRRVILYFYPAAMTPGCTLEACDFRDRSADVETAGATVVGISRDQPDKLAEFARRNSLEFPVLSDADRTVHRSYGVLGTKLVDGVEVEKIRRSTFIIGPDGRLEWAAYDVQAADHAASVMVELCRLLSSPLTH